MNAKTHASAVNTVHSDVPVSSAVDESADLEASKTEDVIPDKLNDNKVDPPPVRDVGYWWITLVCIVLGLLGPPIYYLESFNIYEGRYFQAVTCLVLIVICLKLFTWCKFDVEVTSLIGSIVLWCWLFYGVIELGRAVIIGLPALIIGLIHVLILVINISSYGVEMIVKTTGLDFWVWVSVLMCLLLPVNVPTKMEMKEGLLFSHLYIIVWNMEMLYSALVEKNARASILFLTAVPVLRLPLVGSALYVMVMVAVRINRCLGFSKAYAVPNKVKTTPMSLYAGVERMAPPEEPKVVVERPATQLVNRKENRVETPLIIVQEEKKVPVIETPRADMMMGFNRPIPRSNLGIMAPFAMGLRNDVPSGSQPMLLGRPLMQEPKRVLAGFDPSLLGLPRSNN